MNSLTKFGLAFLIALLCISSRAQAKSIRGPTGIKCDPKQREGDVCPQIYMPVCGFKPDIVCITTPCNYITYSNACEACHDLDVESYTVGACADDKPAAL